MEKELTIEERDALRKEAEAMVASLEADIADIRFELRNLSPTAPDCHPAFRTADAMMRLFQRHFYEFADRGVYFRRAIRRDEFGYPIRINKAMITGPDGKRLF